MKPSEDLVTALDPDSAAWVASLTGGPLERSEGEARLHGMLVQVARQELGTSTCRPGIPRHR